MLSKPERVLSVVLVMLSLLIMAPVCSSLFFWLTLLLALVQPAFEFSPAARVLSITSASALPQPAATGAVFMQLPP